MMKRSLAALAAALFGTTAVHANAADITYTGLQTIGHGTVALSITTNGKIGVLGKASILNYNIVLTDGPATFTLDPDDSVIGDNSDDLFATRNSLRFDFQPDGSTLDFITQGVANAYYLQNVDSSSMFFTVTDGIFSLSEYKPESGDVIIATVPTIASTAPEPAPWALMIAGVGLVGLAFRSARRRQEIGTAV